MKRQPKQLECVVVTVPEDALEPYEAALDSTCETVAFFRDHATAMWRLEAIREAGSDRAGLSAALALAAAASGVAAEVSIAPAQADGWLERTRAAFPEQLIGRRFVIRGTHLTDDPPPGRIAPAHVAAGAECGLRKRARAPPGPGAIVSSRPRAGADRGPLSTEPIEGRVPDARSRGPSLESTRLLSRSTRLKHSTAFESRDRPSPG